MKDERREMEKDTESATSGDGEIFPISVSPYLPLSLLPSALILPKKSLKLGHPLC